MVESLYVLAVALLMASRVPHFSGKSVGRVPREYVAVVLVGVAAALLLVFNFPMQALVAVTLAYLASIPFAVRRYRALDRAGAVAAKSRASFALALKRRSGIIAAVVAIGLAHRYCSLASRIRAPCRPDHLVPHSGWPFGRPPLG